MQVPDELRIAVEEAIAPAREAWRNRERFLELQQLPGKVRAWWTQASALQKEIVATVGLVLFVTAVGVAEEVARKRVREGDDADEAEPASIEVPDGS